MTNGNTLQAWGRRVGGVCLVAIAAGVPPAWCVPAAEGPSCGERPPEAAAVAPATAAGQVREDEGVRTLFAKAEEAEKDGAVNFCGFYTGMPKADADGLAGYYGLKPGEGVFSENAETHEVYAMLFTLHGVRRITKGGNSFGELVQAVSNRVGPMQRKGERDGAERYEYKTIDGVRVTMDENAGCSIHDAPRAQEAETAVRRGEETAQGETEREREWLRLVGEIPSINERLRAGAERKAGDAKTIVLPGGAEMDMVWCPPGCFPMGSPEEEGLPGETRHRVTLTKGFWLAKTEVTQRQWVSVMGSNPSRFKGDNLPVECVDWNDCREFCRRAGLRLPTEAEWEYACRAGTTGPYAGTGVPSEMGWYWDNGSKAATHPVGQKRPNAWGLHDMHGNVAEFCADWCGPYPAGAVTDPAGPSTGASHECRGGSWAVSAFLCRSAYRGNDGPRRKHNALGFRPASSGP